MRAVRVGDSVSDVSALRLPKYVPAGMPAKEVDQRRKRWRCFKIIFGILYSGVVLDISTTALGFQANGSSYEQNPLGSVLIGHLGWIGLWAFMTVLSALCFVSCRVVYWRMRLGWSRLVDVLIWLVALVRWLTIVATISYLMSQPHAFDHVSSSSSSLSATTLVFDLGIGGIILGGAAFSVLLYHVLAGQRVRSTKPDTR